jgi:deoxyribose-phosphate aldolase
MAELTREALVEAIAAAVLERVSGHEDRWACRDLAAGCSPDHMQHMVRRGAERFGLCAPARGYPASIARMIDHTLLKADATAAQIETLCSEARQHGFATVCVNPVWVATCARLLSGTETGVCTVAGFPLGATLPEVKAVETARVIEDGAHEVDMVINVGALKSGDYRLVERDVAGVAACCRAKGAVSKVIIEAALLSDDEKVKACVIAKAAGADFVKTSTGFGPGGATAEDVALMRRVVGPGLGVKAAGGVRDLKAAQAMIEAGADRIGASVGVKIVQESTGAPAGPASGPGGY